MTTLSASNLVPDAVVATTRAPVWSIAVTACSSLTSRPFDSASTI